ncbi:prepilin-type N-terminal cleavage/methylation domain-containing protein, partial [Burkholderia sp. SIMBA_042]
MFSTVFKFQKGFTLIEVLIAFIILSFGLLGAV